MEVKHNRGAEVALEQIRTRSYGREHLYRGRNVVAVGMAFLKDEHGVRVEHLQRNLHTLLLERDINTEPRRFRGGL